MDQPYSWDLFWSDLTKTDAHTAQLTATALILIGIPLLMFSLKSKPKLAIYLISVALIAAGGLELYSDLYKDVPSNEWMLDTFGNFLFGMGVSLFMLFTIGLQLFHAQNLLGMLTDDYNKYVTGFGSFCTAFIIAAILELFDSRYPTIVMILLGFFQLYVVIYPIWKAIQRGRYIFDAFLSVIVYVLCVVGLFAMADHFIVMGVILALCGAGASFGGGTHSISLDNGETLHHDYGDQWSSNYGNSYTDKGGGWFKSN